MIVIALFALVAVLLAIEGAERLRSSRSRYKHRPSFPPGPTPLPLVGNVFGVNRNAPHLTYTAWSKIYGDIVYVRILSNNIVLLNSERATAALLEQRSRKYSDRPGLSLLDMFGFDWLTSVARYGPRFRLHRRLLHQVFHAKVAIDYRGKQLQKAYGLMAHLLDDPARYSEHITTFTVAISMELAYGYGLNGGEKFVSSMRSALSIVSGVATPELFALYTTFPFMSALPSWFPGMMWKSRAAECRRLASDGLNMPYEWVKQRIEQGNAARSMVLDAFIRHHLHDDTKNPELARAIKESSGTLYTAAVKTTYATLLTFVYLMMNHPDVQRRAQVDIDRVVGDQRLPEFDDRPSLPYVDAVLRETLRCHPLAPLGVPHATSEDDIYDGYYIPQGATIVANVWAISHDEGRYPNPDKFLPERFLRDDGSLNDDAVTYAFGFGRRICPGRHVADASLWSAMVCILTLFRLEKTVGSENVKWSTGPAVHPLPFPCCFVPRDDKMDAEKLASLIHASQIHL